MQMLVPNRLIQTLSGVFLCLFFSTVVCAEPLVLSTYMNTDRTKPLLAQLIRVTPDGLAPMDRGRPHSK